MERLKAIARCGTHSVKYCPYTIMTQDPDGDYVLFTDAQAEIASLTLERDEARADFDKALKNAQDSADLMCRMDERRKAAETERDEALAQVPAAYEAAAETGRNTSYHDGDEVAANILTLTPADAKAALDKALRQARADAMREAAVQLEVHWPHIATPEMRDSFLTRATEIEEGGNDH